MSAKDATIKTPKVGLTVWVARDDEGLLWFSFNLLRRAGDNHWWCARGGVLQLPSDHPWGKGLTWDDEPREIKLVDAQEQAYEKAVLSEMVELLITTLRNISPFPTSREYIKNTTRKSAEANVAARAKT